MQIVVGGGLTGLFAARYLQSCGEKVILLEQAPELGGLFKGLPGPNGDSCEGNAFCIGIRYGLTTGVEAIDTLLFEDADERYVSYTESLPEGNYYNGQLNNNTGCIDVRSLPPTLYQKGIVELIEAEGVNGEEKNKREVLINQYGKTFTEEVYGKAVKKIFGLSLEDFEVNGALSLISPRLVAFDSRASLELKKVARLNGLLGYTKKTDNPQSEIKKYFPKNGSTGLWIRDLTQRIESNGGVIYSGVGIKSVQTSEGKVSTVALDDGQELECTNVIWTAPLIHLARLLDVTVPSERPRFLNTGIYNLVVDQPPLSETHWITVYDQEFKSYRLTLYSNISPVKDVGQGYRISIEVLDEREIEEAELRIALRQELVDLGILPKGYKVLWDDFIEFPNAWPVSLTGKDFVDDQAQIIRKHVDNVFMTGRGIKGQYFQLPILLHTHEMLSKHFG
ncbi:NAD(P)-binding protein [Kiloniella majae]|uniref:NAD(P)-binding protein n=1 Tax=Kiloniella majae TaxID=1938558 RepID=UPI000A2784B1|nr:NAD(P)-binding protein [Kiloniella majae]